MRLYPRFLAGREAGKPTRRDFVGLEARRRHAMRLLGRGHSQAEIARRLGVSEVSVCRWNKARLAGGGQPWRRRRLGKPPKVSGHYISVLRGIVAAGAGIYGFPDDRWTYARIAAVLKDIAGLRIHPDHLCRMFQREDLAETRRLTWGPFTRRGNGRLPTGFPSIKVELRLTAPPTIPRRMGA